MKLLQILAVFIGAFCLGRYLLPPNTVAIESPPVKSPPKIEIQKIPNPVNESMAAENDQLKNKISVLERKIIRISQSNENESAMAAKAREMIMTRKLEKQKRKSEDFFAEKTDQYARPLTLMPLRPYRPYRPYADYVASPTEPVTENYCHEYPEAESCLGTLAFCKRYKHRQQCHGTEVFCLDDPKSEYCLGTQINCEKDPRSKFCQGTFAWCNQQKKSHRWQDSCGLSSLFCTENPGDRACYGTKIFCANRSHPEYCKPKKSKDNE